MYNSKDLTLILRNKKYKFADIYSIEEWISSIGEGEICILSKKGTINSRELYLSYLTVNFIDIIYSYELQWSFYESIKGYIQNFELAYINSDSILFGFSDIIDINVEDIIPDGIDLDCYLDVDITLKKSIDSPVYIRGLSDLLNK